MAQKIRILRRPSGAQLLSIHLQALLEHDLGHIASITTVDAELYCRFIQARFYRNSLTALNML